MRIIASLVLLCAAAPASAEEIVHSFRGSKFNDQLLSYETTPPGPFFQCEEEGLRIHYLKGAVPSKAPGICWNMPVGGDFVAEVHYEILQSRAAGIQLYLKLDNPTQDGIALYRNLDPQSGSWVSFGHLAASQNKDRVDKSPKKRVRLDEASHRGWLRLEREGTTLIASFADGDAGPFQEVSRSPIDACDVKRVSVRGKASTVGDPNGRLDLRLLKVRLQAQELIRSGNRSAPAGQASRQRGIWSDDGIPGGWALGATLAGALFLLGGVWLAVRRPRRSSRTPPPDGGGSSPLPKPTAPAGGLLTPPT